MSFFAVLLALLIEQVKPLPRDNWFYEGMISWVGWTGRNFDAGKENHAWVVWCVTVLVPALAAFGLFVGITYYFNSLLLGLAFDVAVLYLTLGFRQFSHYFTDIREALERADETEARRLLAEWRHLDASELPRTELLRHVIEHSLLAAHRHVFGVFFWFVVLSTVGLGPAGAIVYRLAEFSSRYWAFRSHTLGVPTNERLMRLSQRLFGWIDYVPARLTAFGFAVVGNFEEAWRQDASLWRNENEGVILAAAAGAVGVQLGGASAPGVTPDRSKTFESGVAGPETVDAPASTSGAAPRLTHLAAIVRLVWRAVVLWMLLVALLSVAHLIG